MAYIDSEMAKRYRQSPASAEGNTTNENPSSSLEMANSASNASSNANIPGQPVADREPASLGRLHEIDLGQEAKLRNIQRTEAATRKLGTDDQDQDQDPRGLRRGPEPDRKVEDRRNRKRRTSADIERDRLVEEVLRESKCMNPPRDMIKCWKRWTCAMLILI